MAAEAVRKWRWKHTWFMFAWGGVGLMIGAWLAASLLGDYTFLWFFVIYTAAFLLTTLFGLALGRVAKWTRWEAGN
jgi:uncharacterized membrane protein YfcA